MKYEVGLMFGNHGIFSLDVDARNEDEAAEHALQLATDLLVAEDVYRVRDGRFSVTVSLDHYEGMNETYTIQAVDESDAIYKALKRAALSLDIETINGEKYY